MFTAVRNLVKRLLLVSALLVVALPAGAEASYNIRILVQIRQASFQSEGISQTTSESTQTQFLVVTEGVEGRIFIGERVPMVSYYYQYLVSEGYLTGAAITMQEVGTSLVARARVLPDGRIEVTLTPEISYLTPEGRGSLAVTKLTTSVIVPPGQSLEIGGRIARNEFESRFYRGASGQELQIILTDRKSVV